MSFGGRHLKTRDVCMDLEPRSKVRYLVVLQLNSTELGQKYGMEVSIFKFHKICISTQSPAQP